jgi:hypothetical protein
MLQLRRDVDDALSWTDCELHDRQMTYFARRCRRLRGLGRDPCTPDLPYGPDYSSLRYDITSSDNHGAGTRSVGLAWATN